MDCILWALEDAPKSVGDDRFCDVDPVSVPMLKWLLMLDCGFDDFGDPAVLSSHI